MTGGFLNFFDTITNTILDAEVVKSAPLWFVGMLLIVLSMVDFFFMV